MDGNDDADADADEIADADGLMCDWKISSSAFACSRIAFTWVWQSRNRQGNTV